MRAQYQPQELRLLLIGESPPYKCTHFFYYGTGILFRATYEALRKFSGAQGASTTGFLEWLKDKGIFLEDLSHSPLNQLRCEERKQAQEASVAGLAGRLQRLNRPQKVVICMKDIEAHVKKALQCVDWENIHVVVLPFPFGKHRNVFINGLQKIVQQIL